jgi:hypothetical protein
MLKKPVRFIEFDIEGGYCGIDTPYWYGLKMNGTLSMSKSKTPEPLYRQFVPEEDRG